MRKDLWLFLATFEEMNVEIKDSLYALFAIRKMEGEVLKSFGNDEVFGHAQICEKKRHFIRF